MVGVEGFEPPTSRSQSARSTSLSQTPIVLFTDLFYTVAMITSCKYYTKYNAKSVLFYTRFFYPVKGLLQKTDIYFYKIDNLLR